MKLKKHVLVNIFYVVSAIIIALVIISEIIEATTVHGWYVCQHDEYCEKNLYNKATCLCYQRFIKDGE